MANKRETLKLMEEVVEEKIKEIKKATNDAIKKINTEIVNKRKEAVSSLISNDGVHITINGLTLPISNLYLEGATNKSINVLIEKTKVLQKECNDKITELNNKVKEIKREVILNGLSDEIRNTITSILDM